MMDKSDILNKPILDEDTQMDLFDNIEYDLNENYYKNKNSKLTFGQTTNFSNLDFSIKTDSIEYKPSTSKRETNKKHVQLALNRIHSNPARITCQPKIAKIKT